MADLVPIPPPGLEDGEEKISIGLYEAGSEAKGGFHVFNIAENQYHRAEVLQRTGAVDITCELEKVVHGAVSPDSDRYATLIVMQWSFQAKGTSRISEATIELTFEASTGDGLVEVEAVSFPGSYSLMPTTQEHTVTKGGEANIGLDQILSLSGRWEKSMATTTSDAITLNGGKRVVDNKPPNRMATWTLSENRSQPAGIPTGLRVAILVSRDDQEKFLCRLDFSCETDIWTTAKSLFKKIPKDDPIIFQPDAQQKGTRPHKNVTYGDEQLGSVDLDDLSDVTFRTIVTDSQKSK